MTEDIIKEYLKEARENGGWVACFYWENKLEKKKINNKIK